MVWTPSLVSRILIRAGHCQTAHRIQGRNDLQEQPFALLLRMGRSTRTFIPKVGEPTFYKAAEKTNRNSKTAAEKARSEIQQEIEQVDTAKKKLE